jgi:hypothetical protein
LLKLNETWSMGVMSPCSAPPVWYELTSTSLNLKVRYSCWVFPALRAVSVASLMCFPLAHASISFGEAFVSFMTKWKSCIETLPAPPPPPPDCGVPDWTAPQLQDSMSISFLCFASLLSPSTPSILRK